MPNDVPTPPSSRALHIVQFGYDWGNFSRTQPEIFADKLRWKQIDIDRHILYEFCWSDVDRDEWLRENYHLLSWKTGLRRLRRAMLLESARRVLRWFEENGRRPDLYVTSSFETLLVGLVLRRRYGTRIVMYGIGRGREVSFTRPLSRLRYVWTALIETLNRGIPDLYFALSRGTVEYLISIGVPEERIVHYVPNTITNALGAASTAGVSPPRSEIRERLGIPPEAPILTCVARLEPEKDHARLLDLVAAIRPDLHVVFAGSGGLQERLEAQARDLNIADRVHFPGALGRADLWSLYADTAVFVLLSKSEALGIVVLEAMAAGVPVIGSEAVGIVESIGAHQERGRILRASDGPAEFATLINDALTPSPARDERIARAQTHVLLLFEGNPTLEAEVYKRFGLGSEKTGAAAEHLGMQPSSSSPICSE